MVKLALAATAVWHDRFRFLLFVLGWPPVRNVLAQFVFFLIASVIGIFLFPFSAACGRALRLNRAFDRTPRRNRFGPLSAAL